MANEVRLDLNLQGEQQTARGLRNVGDAADKAGSDLDKMAKDAGFLDKRIGELRGGLKSLIQEFDKTGDVDLLKKIRTESRELNKFNRLKKQLVDLSNDAGLDAGAALIAGLRSAVSRGGPYVIGGLVALAAAALPFIGASVAAAVTGSAGGGGIIGGVALAARDPRVQDEAAKLGGHISNVFSRVAEPFVAPAIEALGVLRAAGDDVAGDLRQAMASVAPVLVPLTRGLTGLVEETLPGFTAAMVQAKPVIRALASELPDIGRAIGDFFETISEDPDGAIMAIKALSVGIQAALRYAGFLISALSGIYEFTVRANSVVGGFAEKWLGWLPVAGSAFRTTKDMADAQLAALERAKDGSGDFAGELDNVADSATSAAQELVELQTAMDKMFGDTLDLHQATINYQRAIDDLAESVKENGRSLDERTEKGRANRSAVLDEIQAIKDLRDANIANNMLVDEANSIYDQQLEQLRKTATSLGLNKDQVDQLIDAYKRLPAMVEVEVRAPGLLAALAQARELSRLLGSTSAAARARSGDKSGFGGGRAGGGPMYPGQTYVVGEEGLEVVEMFSGGGAMVHSTTKSKAMPASRTAGATAAIAGAMTANDLARAMKTALTGVAVVLDGRVVGQVQALQADLYLRGG